MHKSSAQVKLFFHICPKCLRAVPENSQERYCINDGTELFKACPNCETQITNPFGRYCAACGHPLFKEITQERSNNIS